MSDGKYDLNIDNYSEEELCKIIKYKGDIQDLTPEYLQEHIGQIINNSKKNTIIIHKPLMNLHAF